tara:strand:+ start:169 stop:4098 length:3930 start_codon:yes stop_codon:yes gene_type:complete
VLNDEYAFNDEMTAIALTREILTSVSPILEGCYVRVILGRAEDDTPYADLADTAISTSFLPEPRAVLDDLQAKIEEIGARYDDCSHILIDDVKVLTICPNPENGAAGTRRTEANKTWLVPGEWNTQINCFYVAWAMAMDKARFATEYADWLEGKRKSYPEYKQQAQHKKTHAKQALAKSGEPFRDAYVDNELISRIVAHSKPRPTVLVYGGQFQLLYDSSHDMESTAVRPTTRSQHNIAAAMPRSISMHHCNLQQQLSTSTRAAFTACSDHMETHTTTHSLAPSHSPLPDELPTCSQDKDGQSSATAKPKRKRVRRMPGPLIELQRSRNHYRPMIRWSDLDPSLCERIQRALALKAEAPAGIIQEAQKIRETFKAKEARDRRFVAWDSETAPESNGGFKSYAAGMAWYRAPFANGDEPPGLKVYNDGEHEMLYISFWGLLAMQQMVHFLHEHRAYFAESYFWAHNGGKFDLPLLMREVLFNFEGARIEGERCTILGGRWIGFQALLLDGGHGESRIYFRDSFAVLTGALDKLCKDYRVPHQKLGDVDHDAITLDNWHTFPKLKPYLTHDCLGLLELLDRFGAEIFEMSSTEKVERHYGERNTANVLEALLGLPPLSFTKQRPSWLKNAEGSVLELDGYCKDARVAFEFQDPYHYEAAHPFHRLTPGGFAKRVADDQAKVVACATRGVRLVVVPHSEKSPAKLLAFCKRELTKLGAAIDSARPMTTAEVTRDRVLKSGGICLSQAMTAAGIAKRCFYNRFYGKYPLFTLTEEQDGYIRISYFGGRVELFRLGVVDGPVFYLDFTSLYPAMGAAHVMPYGEPMVWPSFPPPPEGGPTLPREFFGFVRCWVRSTERGMTRKPLHGVKSAGTSKKLLFAYLGEWRVLTLFSEELREGEKEGLYEYQPTDGIGFKRGPLLRETFESLFALKAQAKAEGKGTKEKAIKVVANSTYGFFGIRTKDREGIRIYQSDDVPIYDFLARGALIEEADHGRYTCLRVKADMDLKDFNVGVAAAVTSYARIKLWHLMDDIEQCGGVIYSCDTDSVTTSLDLSLHPELRDRYIPDWNSDAPGALLGSLKCECTDEIEKVLKKRGLAGEALQRAMAIERGSVDWKPIPFSHPEGTLVNGANKLYALRTQIKHGGEFELCKAKGMSKGGFTFANYLAMFDPDNPKPLTDPKPMYFKLGLSGYCTDGGIQPVRKVILSKKEAKACYTKGDIDATTGVITPFTLTDAPTVELASIEHLGKVVGVDLSADAPREDEGAADEDWGGPDEDWGGPDDDWGAEAGDDWGAVDEDWGGPDEDWGGADEFDGI